MKMERVVKITPGYHFNSEQAGGSPWRSWLGDCCTRGASAPQYVRYCLDP